MWRARKLVKLRHKRLLLLARCGVPKFGAVLDARAFYTERGVEADERVRISREAATSLRF